MNAANKRSREDEEEEEEEYNKTSLKRKLESNPERISIQRLFMMYCKSNKPDQVKKCLKFPPQPMSLRPHAYNVDINCNLHHIKETALTPLMFACIHGYHDIVKVLSRDPRAQD